MNLLDKLWLALLLAAALTIFSCENPSDVGLELDPDGLRVDVHYKELPISSTNLFIDSLRTDEYSRLLVGRTVDQVFGTTEVRALSQIGVTAGFTNTDSLIYIYDSAFMYLELDYVHAAESLTDQTIRLHQIEDTLFVSPFYLADFETGINTSEIGGEITFVPADLGLIDNNDDGVLDADTLSMRLNDTMGNQLFDILRSDGSLAEALRNGFKGLALVADPANNAILGFQAAGATRIELHYHTLDPYTDDMNMATDSIYQDSLTTQFFTSFNGSARYNQYRYDRASSTIGNAIGDNLEGFDTQDGSVYYQPASGIFPVLDFSPLNEFFLEFPRVQINRMEVEMATGLDALNFNNVSDARFLYINEKFDIVNEDTVYNNTYKNIDTDALFANSLTNLGIMTDQSYLSGTPQQLVMPIDDGSAKGEITLFGQFLDRGILSARKFVLMPTDFSLPNRTIIDQESVKLKIYYTLPKED